MILTVLSKSPTAKKRDRCSPAGTRPRAMHTTSADISFLSVYSFSWPVWKQHSMFYGLMTGVMVDVIAGKSKCESSKRASSGYVTTVYSNQYFPDASYISITYPGLHFNQIVYNCLSPPDRLLLKHRLDTSTVSIQILLHYVAISSYTKLSTRIEVNNGYLHTVGFFNIFPISDLLIFQITPTYSSKKWSMEKLHTTHFSEWSSLSLCPSAHTHPAPRLLTGSISK